MAIDTIKGLTQSQITSISGVSLSNIEKINNISFPTASSFSTYSLKFDGTNDYASLGNNIAGPGQLASSALFPSTAADFSLSFWIRFATGRSSNTGIKGLFNRRYSNQTWHSMYYFPNNGNVIWQKKVNNVTTFQKTMGSIFNLTDNVWYQFVFTNDVSDTTNGFKIYRNSEDITPSPAAVKTAISSASIESSDVLVNKMEWGRWFNRSNYVVASEIDDFAIHHSVLDQSNVTAMYNSSTSNYINGAPIDLTSDSGNYDQSSNLEHYYKFENNGTDSGNGSAGSVTLYNDASYSNTNPAGS